MTSNRIIVLLLSSLVISGLQAMNQNAGLQWQSQPAMAVDSQPLPASAPQDEEHVPDLVPDTALPNPQSPTQPNKLQQQIALLKKEGSLVGHRSVNSDQFPCVTCHRSFKSEKGLQTHQKSHDTVPAALRKLLPAAAQDAVAQLVELAQSPSPSSSSSSSTMTINLISDDESEHATPQEQSHSRKRKHLKVVSNTEDKIVLGQQSEEENEPKLKKPRLELPQQQLPELPELPANSVPTNDELFKAIAANSAIEVESLLARKADANAMRWKVLNNTSVVYETALATAAKLGNTAIVNKLLDAKANPNIGTSHALINAVQQGSLDSIYMLLQAGAQSDARTYNGGTAMTAANANPMLKEVILAILETQKKIAANNGQAQNS